ncbi:MAG: hypothetical protein QGI24_10315 [Kiritimatiellia bacterium]|jgi:hypothetical protein|nr:hypothetical protein [Kiritimatiellia bacterium]MDP6849167.1 hypothetical protein [Kiritimatiellia bacterium]
MKLDADRVLDVVTRLLPDMGIDVLMIGGHAVNAYGVSRATQDIDFMIAADNVNDVRQIMHDAGFTNLAVHQTVTFFSRPGSSLRVDFLKVDRGTMDALMANARKVNYFSGYSVWIPELKDLLAMKLFALASVGAKREDKDFSDIVNLSMENHLDPDTDLCELCEKFGTAEIYQRICNRIRELRDD